MKTIGDIISALLMVLALIVALVVMTKIGVILPFAFLVGTFMAASILAAGILLANRSQGAGHTPDR